MGLSDEDVIEMRQKRAEKPWLWSWGGLADWYGCSPRTAIDICTYRTRKNVGIKHDSACDYSADVQE